MEPHNILCPTVPKYWEGGTCPLVPTLMCSNFAYSKGHALKVFPHTPSALPPSSDNNKKIKRDQLQGARLLIMNAH